MNHPPIARDPSLQPLSRDHYAGLVQARHLIRAADGDADERRAALDDFFAAWERELHEHLLDEERLLMPLISDRAMADRLRREHETLRTLVDRAKGMSENGSSPDPTSMRAMGELLHDHIRWEERELFAAIQAEASGEALAALKTQTAKIESVRPRWIDRSPPGHAARE